jgi:hypothetical protein
MEAQVKQQKQQQKQKQPQKQQGKQGKPNDAKAGKEEKEPVVYERPRAYGWYTVVFPQINSDLDYHMALWLDNALSWVRAQGIKQFSWTFAHGTKKDGEKTSPVFFFKDLYQARQTSWYLSGELLE